MYEPQPYQPYQPPINSARFWQRVAALLLAKFVSPKQAQTIQELFTEAETIFKWLEM